MCLYEKAHLPLHGRSIQIPRPSLRVRALKVQMWLGGSSLLQPFCGPLFYFLNFDGEICQHIDSIDLTFQQLDILLRKKRKKEKKQCLFHSLLSRKGLYVSNFTGQSTLSNLSTGRVKESAWLPPLLCCFLSVLTLHFSHNSVSSRRMKIYLISSMTNKSSYLKFL